MKLKKQGKIPSKFLSPKASPFKNCHALVNKTCNSSFGNYKTSHIRSLSDYNHSNPSNYGEFTSLFNHNIFTRSSQNNNCDDLETTFAGIKFHDESVSQQENSDKINYTMHTLKTWDKANLNKQRQIEMNEKLFNNLTNYYSRTRDQEKLTKLTSLNKLIKNQDQLPPPLNSKTNNKFIEEISHKANKEQAQILLNSGSKTKNKFNQTFFNSSSNGNFQQNLNVSIKNINKEDLTIQYYRNIIKEKRKNEKLFRDDLVQISYLILLRKIERNRGTNIKDDGYRILKNSTKTYEEHTSELGSEGNNPENKYAGSTFTYDGNQKGMSFNSEFTDLKGDLNTMIKENDIYLNHLTDEINYFKHILDNGVNKQRNYFLDILERGFDVRSEGLVWVVKKLYELRTYLHYNHFPKFLSHEQIDFGCNLGMLSIESSQGKLILHAIKKRQQIIKRENKNELFKHVTEIFNSQISIKNITTESYQRIDAKFSEGYNKYANIGSLNKNGYEQQIEEKKSKAIVKMGKDNIIYQKPERARESEGEIIKFMINHNDNYKKFIGNIIEGRNRIEEIDKKKEVLIKDEISEFKKRYQNNNKINNTVGSSVQYDLIYGALFGNAVL